MAKDFDGQREGEEVVFIFRRHILTSIKGFFWFLIVSALSVVPVLVWGGELWGVMLGGFIVGIVGWLYSYMLWYFSVYIVTNERIRQVNQKGLFKKTVVDLGLNKIQSVSYKVPGIFGGMFGYGTILIQTVVGDMMVSMVRKPEDVYNKLQNAAVRAGSGDESE